MEPLNPVIADQASRKAAKKIVPFLMLMFVFAYLDRINIGFAKQALQSELGFSNAVFAMGVGLFFIAYAVFEVPSNIIMHHVGARRWMARIMITWGLVAAGFAFATSETSFYALRLLLGFAEAGFAPASFTTSAAGSLSGNAQPSWGYSSLRCRYRSRSAHLCQASFWI